MASARKTGANENVQTYDSAGGKDFTALSVWESATDIDIKAADQAEALEIAKGYHDDRVFLSFATCDTTRFRVMRPIAGEGHRGIPLIDSTIATFTRTVRHTSTWGIADFWSRFEDLCFDNNYDDASEGTAVYLQGDNTSAIGCLIIRAQNATGGATGFKSVTGANSNFIDCLAHDCKTRAFQTTSGATSNFYNCTENLCGESINIGSGTTANTKNCVLDDTINNGGTHNQTTNVTGTPTYRDSANNDFRLDGVDTVARGGGTDLSADATFPFDDDIADRTMGAAKSGKKRVGTWDTGFHQFYSRSHTT